MKRLLLALVIVGLLVGLVGATSLNFQSGSDFTSYSMLVNSSISKDYHWAQNTTGGNNYVYNFVDDGYSVTTLPNANMMTYSSATILYYNINWASPYVRLMDASGNLLYQEDTLDQYCTAPCRWEMQMSGGVANLYNNGILRLHSGVLSVNPSYVGWGTTDGRDQGCCGYATVYWDDMVWGESENKYVFSLPEEGAYKLVKDFTNPASSGLAASNGTIVASTSMSSTFSRSNISYAGNESIVLMNLDTGTTYQTRYTGVYATGTVYWNLTEFFASSAPYGRYVVTIPGSGSYSEEIWYLGSGASIAFDKDDYSGQDTATMTYNVLGAYWDTSTYSYSIDVVSGTTGATMHSEAISTSSGTSSYTFASTDPLGVYYGIVKATKHSDGSVIWMNYDYAELTSFVTITGYVNDAETGLPLLGANINITQNDIINNLTTIADGNYSATNYLSGMAITINATASSYLQYSFTFTPLAAQNINLNISLAPLSPTVSGIGIGGIARETAYGRPLPDVSVWVVNTSNSQSYTKSTSMTGWYLCDEGTTCFLVNERPYDVWGTKPGYSDSANATVVA